MTIQKTTIQMKQVLNSNLDLIQQANLLLQEISGIYSDDTYKPGGEKYAHHSFKFSKKYNQLNQNLMALSVYFRSFLDTHLDTCNTNSDDFLRTQEILHQQVINQLGTMRLELKIKQIEQNKSIVSSTQEGLKTLSDAMSAEGVLTGSLNAVLELPAAMLGLPKLFFEIEQAKQEMKKAVTELGGRCLKLQVKTLQNIHEKVSSLRREQLQTSTAEGQFKLLHQYLCNLKSIIQEDINKLSVFSSDGFNKSMIESLKKARNQTETLIQSAKEEKIKAIGNSAKSGLLTELGLYHERKVKEMSTRCRKNAESLDEAIEGLKIYLDKKTAGQFARTGYGRAINYEKFLKLPSERMEHAFIKIAAVHKLTTYESKLDLNAHLLASKKNPTVNDFMVTFCNIENDVHEIIGKLKKHPHEPRVKLFMFAAIHAIRNRSQHMLNNGAYANLMIQMLTLVYHAFKADKRHDISKKNYYASVEVIRQLSKQSKLKGIIKDQERNGKTEHNKKEIRSLFSKFNSSYNNAQAILQASNNT